MLILVYFSLKKIKVKQINLLSEMHNSIISCFIYLNNFTELNNNKINQAFTLTNCETTFEKEN